MPKTRENWLDLVNSCIYYAHQAHKIFCLTQWISKLPRSFEIHWVRQNLVNEVLYGIKGLWASKMGIKLKSNLYMGPVDIYPNFYALV